MSKYEIRMDLDVNLFSLQAELRALDKGEDKLKRIKYKGGNEEILRDIINAVKVYCIDAGVLRDKTRSCHFITFLLINCNTENNLSITKEHEHLVNVIPTLTCCVIANIIIDVNLVDQYCELMHTLPLKLNKELLFEIEICLKHCNLTDGLNCTSKLLKALIALFESYETAIARFSELIRDNEILEQICDVANHMLKNIAYFSPEKARELKFVKLQEHMGYSLLEILRIINLCLHRMNLHRFLDCAISVAIKIMEAVTLSVFCVWAQVKCENGTPLQMVVAEEAYIAIEHLQKYKPAGMLIEMLGTVARKPKTLTERIEEADLSDVIFQINRADEHQLLWFRALVNLNVSDDKEAIKCLKKWHHLCKPDDVVFMLNSCKNVPLTIQCARNLDVPDLKNVIIKSFWKGTHILSEDIDKELILFLNKFEDSEDVVENSKSLLILTLQNRECVLRMLYEKCLEKSAVASKYKSIFNILKDVMEVNDFCKTIFLKVIESNLPKDQNITCYRALFTVLLELNYFPDEYVYDIFNTCLQGIENDGNMLASLTLFNMLPVKYQLSKGQENLGILLLNLLEKYRGQFYELPLAPAIAQECIDLLSKFSENIRDLRFEDKLSEVSLTHVNKYYMIKFTSPARTKFLQYLYMSEISGDSAECVVKLINVLPICVKSEWILIANEVVEQFSYETTLKMYGQVIFSISQLGASAEIDSKIVYCLQQYSVIVKDVLQPRYNTLKDGQVLARRLCLLLKTLPESICKTEAVRLAGLLSNEVLRSLKEDRDFVLLLIAIQDTGMSQLLVQRMLQ